MEMPAACVRPSICARSSTAFPVTPCIKTSPPWDKRLSITRICDSVITSALWQPTQLKTERTFLLAAFTLALLCSRNYTTAPCPSSAAPINCVHLFNLTSVYVRLRPLRANANTAQGPQKNNHPRNPFVLMLLLLLILQQVTLSQANRTCSAKPRTSRATSTS